MKKPAAQDARGHLVRDIVTNVGQAIGNAILSPGDVE
jgi:hypothetical protein